MPTQRTVRAPALPRAPGALGAALSALSLALLPKCPACFAAYITLWTGLGFTVSAAGYVRTALIALGVLSLASLVVSFTGRAGLRARKSGP